MYPRTPEQAHGPRAEGDEPGPGRGCRTATTNIQHAHRNRGLAWAGRPASPGAGLSAVYALVYCVFYCLSRRGGGASRWAFAPGGTEGTTSRYLTGTRPGSATGSPVPRPADRRTAIALRARSGILSVIVFRGRARMRKNVNRVTPARTAKRGRTKSHEYNL